MSNGNFKVCYRLKEEYQDVNKPSTIEVKDSANFFDKRVAERLANVANTHFTRAEHWVERRR